MTPGKPDDATQIQRIESGLMVEPTLRREEPARVALAERLAFHRVPGVSIAVIEEGEIAWARGYGVREAGGHDPVAPETRFQAASISKPTTALAVLRLVQEGRLDLDEDVNRYLRSWRVPPNDDWQPRLTLRHLLSHTGGVTVHGFPGYRPDEPTPTVRQVLDGEPPANTPPIRVDTLPGLRFRYAGGGTTIVQQLLSDVVGAPFPELMRALVLDPLGMAHSAFAQPPMPDPATVAATGHREDGVPLQGKWHVYPEMAAAGLWTTPADLCRLAITVQRAIGGVDEAFLRRDVARAMLTRQFGSELGLGFFLEGTDATLRFSHGGGNEGFRCYLVAYTDRPQGAAVMTNADGGWALNGEILRTVAAEYGWLLDPSYTSPPTARAEARPIVLAADTLASYEGEYVVRPDFRVTIALVDGALQVQPTGQSAFAVDPVSETTFVARPLNVEVTFRRDDGGVRGLTLRQDGTEMSGRKGEA